MNWRALLLNQWFQLCLLVAALSGGTTIYNFTRSNPNPPPKSNVVTPSPMPQPNPSGPLAPQRRIVTKLTPKKRGQWILDASGSGDSDGGELEAVAASLVEGDTVTVRAGTYTGSCEIAVSARFVGPAAGKGVATIRSVDSQRAGCSITGKKVSFENVSVNFDAAGDSPAIQVLRDANFEMLNCSVATQSKFGILVSENASLSAQDSNFAAPAAGCCLKYGGTTRGTLNRCNFSAGRWGLEAVNAAQVQGSNCTFQNIGLVNGVGLVIGVVGGRASVKLEACQFNGNSASILADEGAYLQVIGSAFRTNGVTGEEGNSSVGTICVQTGAKVSLKEDTFEDNKQGLVALKAGSLTLQSVQMRRTGLITNNQKLSPYCNAIGASEQGTTVNVAGSTITDSLNHALIVSGGAHLKVVETTITNSNESGLVLGFPNVGASQAELNNVRFVRSHNHTILVNSGSHLEMQNCQVSESDLIGIVARDSGTQARLVDTSVSGCKTTGINANAGAVITATGCKMENTTRGAQAGLPNEPQRAGRIVLQNCTVRGNSVFGVGACRGATLEMKGGFLGNNREDTFHESGGNVQLSR
jgi:parallel beta helix pectate lyase-like protein